MYEYNYGETENFITFHQEVAYRIRKWNKETRDWREYIEEHIDAKHAETQNLIKSEAQQTRSAVSASEAAVKSEVKTSENAIRNLLSSISSTISSIWAKVSSL